MWLHRHYCHRNTALCVFILVSLRLLMLSWSPWVGVMGLYFCPRNSAVVKVATAGLLTGHSDINRSVRMKHLPDVNRRQRKKKHNRPSQALWFAEHDLWHACSSNKVYPLLHLWAIFFVTFLSLADCFASFSATFNTFFFPPEHLVAQLSFHKHFFPFTSPSNIGFSQVPCFKKISYSNFTICCFREFLPQSRMTSLLTHLS